MNSCKLFLTINQPLPYLISIIADLVKMSIYKSSPHLLTSSHFKAQKNRYESGHWITLKTGEFKLSAI